MADNLAESIKLKYTDGGLTPATNTTTIVVSAAVASKLAITNSAVTVTAGVASGTITVQSQDLFGNPQTNAAVVTVNLTSSSASGTFYSTNGITVITSTNIPVNQTTAGYFYKDTVAGSPTITNAGQRPDHRHAGGDG